MSDFVYNSVVFPVLDCTCILVKGDYCVESRYKTIFALTHSPTLLTIYLYWTSVILQHARPL
jgi:hypothetical protein